MDMKLHCSLCEGEDVFTILNGNSYCYHCYDQMDKVQNSEEARGDDSNHAILEIRDIVRQILEKLNQS